MANSSIIVGKLAHNPVLLTTSTNKAVTNMLIEVERPFKNSKGEVVNDYIPCVAWNSIATNTCKYAKQGDLVSIQGRLQKTDMHKPMEIVVEHIKYLWDKRDE